MATRFLKRLCAAAERVEDQRRQVCDDVGLGDPRQRALEELALRGDAGCSQTELAAALGLAESSLCGLVDKMQHEGLLFRFRSKTDRRKSLLVLTHAGQKRLDEATAALEAYIDNWLHGAADGELEQLGRWLDGLAPRHGQAKSVNAVSTASAPPDQPVSESGPYRWKEAG